MKDTKLAVRCTLILLTLILAAVAAGGDVLAQSKAAKAPAAPPVPDKGMGQKSAPITIEVFSDYQCPACRELYFQTLRPLIENYVNTGKVYLLHRDMPLPSHQHSRAAASFANAAAIVKRLERVTVALYQNQHLWSADGNVEVVVASVLTPAEMRRVRQLVESGTLTPHIDSDVARANLKRVRSTPTILVTHRGQEVPIVGVVQYAMLRQFLDELLKK